jgi:predicted N-acyltransferase
MEKIRVHDSVKNFSKDQWDALNMEGNPFVAYDFFLSLEEGQCVKGHIGWHPLFFCGFENEKINSAVIIYLKTDSYGEFIFDWDWARAYQEHGLAYYPKMTSAIPFSPITAPKFLGDHKQIQSEVLPALWDFYQKNDVSGLHFLFTSAKEGELLQKLGLIERDSFQYHWHRGNCLSFEDFLGTLKKNRRKSIKRERREVASHKEIQLITYTGQEITSEMVSFFYKCYLTTIDKKWSQAYLTESFFQNLIQRLPQFVILVIATEAEQPVACALYLKSQTTLFGRYWGAIKEIPFLHFEFCLYQGIELTIKHRLKVFEAGAQGEHKRLRGFRPVLTKSWHHLKHPQFFPAVKDFLKRERLGIEQLFNDFENESPIKKDVKD